MACESQPLHVVCDRCRAEGLAGEDPFQAFGALLDFEPVPRLRKRADGWDAEAQRAYIAALSLTGSDRAATRAVGKSAFGVTQLIEHEGSESFRAARDEAMAMAADERSRRLAEGVRAIAAGEAAWRPPEPPWSHADSRIVTGPPEPDPKDEAAQAVEAAEYLTQLFRRYVIKIEDERKARLAGRIVAADFYVRQITVIEISMDLLCDGRLLDRLEELSGEEAPVELIADTPMSRALDLARRARWAELGEPERPPPPPSALLLDRIGYRLLGLETFRGDGGGRDWRAYADWCAERDSEHAAAARAQVEWEEKARREAAEWRARVEAEEGTASDGAEGEAPKGAEGEGP